MEPHCGWAGGWVASGASSRLASSARRRWVGIEDHERPNGEVLWLAMDRQRRELGKLCDMLSHDREMALLTAPGKTARLTSRTGVIAHLAGSTPVQA